MKRKVLSLALALLLVVGLLQMPATASAASSRSGTSRALLIGCGEYIVSSANLSPSPENDVKAMEAIFKRDARYSAVHTYLNVRTTANQPASGDTLMTAAFTMDELIAKAFAGATSADTSVFYYSGHGAMYNGDACLHMSDLQLYSAAKLRAALDKVPGKKVIILDSCFSGGAISKSAKGSADLSSAFIKAFSRSAKGSLNAGDYVVLTAASQNESSWGDSEGESDYPMGEFTRALASALGSDDAGSLRTAADENVDGTVTLHEAYQYIRYNSILSKAQVYPEESAFPLYQYTATANSTPFLVGLKISSSNGAAPYLASFRTLNSFSGTVTIRRLRITRQSASTINFAMNTIATLHEGTIGTGQQSFVWNGAEAADGEAGDDYFLCIREAVTGWQRLIPFTANSKVAPVISVTAPNRFDIVGEEELCVEVGYNTRCSIDVILTDQSGKTVYTLASEDPAVPEKRTEGDEINLNKYYWNGQDKNGDYLPAGEYTLKVRAYNEAGTLPWQTQPLTITGGIAINSMQANVSIFDPDMEQFQVNFTAPGGHVTYDITTENGTIVYTSPSYPVGTGVNTVSWNGKDAAGASVAEGKYEFVLTLRKDAMRVAKSAKFELQNAGAKSLTGTPPTEWSLSRGGLLFTWNATASGTTEVSFTNTSGFVVYSEKLKTVVGDNLFKWSGLMENKAYIPDGDYELKLALTKKSGEVATLTQTIKVFMFPNLVSASLTKTTQPATTAIQIRANVDGQTKIVARIKKGNKILLTRKAFAAKAGDNTINWTLKDENGNFLAPGEYIVSLTLELGGQQGPEYTLPITLS